MGNGGSGKPPRLTENAPTDLKEFVACKRMTVVLDLNRLDWVPTQGTGFGDIRVETGATPNTATVVIDGPIGAEVEMDTSIKDGMLVLDTSNISDLFGPIRRRIDGWVKALNDTMKRNGKQLESFTKRGSKVTLTKTDVAPPPPSTEPGDRATGAVPVTPPAPEPTEPPAEPAQEPSDDSSGSGLGCLTKIIGAGVLVLGGVGAYFGFVRDGDDEQADDSSEQVAEDAQDPVTDEPAEPVTEPAPEPADQPEDDPPEPVEPDEPVPDPVEPDEPDEPEEPAPDATSSSGSDLDVLAPIFGQYGDFFLSSDGGGTFIYTPTLPGNAVDCETGEVGVGGQHADLLAVLGRFDDGLLTVDVRTALTPALSEQDWSSAVTLQVIARDRVVRSFGYERHDGVLTVGEYLEDGSVDPADITLTDGVVRLNLPLDEPPDFVRVDGFNTPNEGDSLTCDSTLGVTDPFSIPTTPGRFEPMLDAPGEPFVIEPSPSDGTLFVRGDEQLLVRVLDACSVNEHYWITAVGSAEFVFDLTVDDTASGELWGFRNGEADDFIATIDTAAFATCP